MKRCDKILQDYEDKLHLVDKFLKAKKLVSEINQLAGRFDETRDSALIKEIMEISNHILEEF